jgi:hypothetical protein
MTIASYDVAIVPPGVHLPCQSTKRTADLRWYQSLLDAACHQQHLTEEEAIDVPMPSRTGSNQLRQDRRILSLSSNSQMPRPSHIEDAGGLMIVKIEAAFGAENALYTLIRAARGATTTDAPMPSGRTS